jgi:hypothetical protein
VNDFPYVAPPPDGLQRAFTDARGRRFRKAGLSTSTVAAGLAVLALVAGGQGTQSLVQQPSPQQPAVSQLVPDDGREQLPSVPRPNQGQNVQVFGTHQQRSTSASGGQSDGSQLGGSASAPLRDQHAAPRSAGRPYVAGPMARQDNYGTYLPDPNCPLPRADTQTAELCSYAYYGTQSGPAPYRLQGEVCSTGRSLALLHFTGRNEVDMAVTTAKGKEVWRWSTWHPDRAYAHTISVDGGHCTEWVFDWTGVSSQGAKLPKGEYTLRVTFLAAELAQQRVRTTALTIS